MRKFFASVAIAFVLSGTAYAQDFQKGWKAYEAGDYTTALQELKPLAEQGDALGQIGLGHMYRFGSGVLQNNVVAHMWFNIANANGNKLGGEYRDTISASMSLEAIEKAQTLARECMASGYQNCGS